jgi:hypothetical protein
MTLQGFWINLKSLFFISKHPSQSHLSPQLFWHNHLSPKSFIITKKCNDFSSNSNSQPRLSLSVKSPRFVQVRSCSHFLNQRSTSLGVRNGRNFLIKPASLKSFSNLPIYGASIRNNSSGTIIHLFCRIAIKA